MRKLKDLWQCILPVAALALLASCSGKPTGQVVAKVAGQEITTADLRLETAQIGGNSDSPAAQQQALQTLIARKLLVREAANRKLDVSPEGQSAADLARELALIDLLRSKLVSEQPSDVSDTAVSKYIVAHPSQFSERKLITADQLVVASGDASLGAKLQAVGDFSAIEAYLTQNNLRFARSGSVVDTAQLSPEAAAKIEAIPLNTAYAVPSSGGPVRVMRVLSTQSAPLTGSDARDNALLLMQAGRSQAAIGSIQKIVAKGKAKVWIDPAFASG
jgi:EpsD family peptidyl-prolyl cis-trans isomerase